MRPRRSQLQGSESSGYHALMGTNGEIILLDIFSGAEVPVRDFNYPGIFEFTCNMFQKPTSTISFGL